MLGNFDHIRAYWVRFGKAAAQTALHFGANDLDGTITDGGELTYSYSVESNNEVKMTKQEVISVIESAGFEAGERDRFITGWRKRMTGDEKDKQHLVSKRIG